jgi:uncharacterized protein Veg
MYGSDIKLKLNVGRKNRREETFEEIYAEIRR